MNQILSLWERKSKEGKTFYTGKVSLGVLGEEQIVVFPNTNKQQDDNKPSLLGYLSKPKPEDNQQSNQPPIPDDDDIPF